MSLKRNETLFELNMSNKMRVGFFCFEILPSITYVINIERNRSIQTTTDKMIETSVSRKTLKSF